MNRFLEASYGYCYYRHDHNKQRKWQLLLHYFYISYL